MRLSNARLAITVYYVVFLRSCYEVAGEVVSSLPATDVASFTTLQPLYTQGLLPVFSFCYPLVTDRLIMCRGTSHNLQLRRYVLLQRRGETLYVYAQEDETQSAATVARGSCNFLCSWWNRTLTYRAYIYIYN